MIEWMDIGMALVAITISLPNSGEEFNEWWLRHGFTYRKAMTLSCIACLIVALVWPVIVGNLLSRLVFPK